MDGITTIRLEVIDALETHFSAEGNEFHHQKELAIGARDEFLKKMGFGKIRYVADQPFIAEQVKNHPVVFKLIESIKHFC